MDWQEGNKKVAEHLKENGRVSSKSACAGWKVQCEICGKTYECDAGDAQKFICGLGDGCASNATKQPRRRP